MWKIKINLLELGLDIGGWCWRIFGDGIFKVLVNFFGVRYWGGGVYMIKGRGLFWYVSFELVFKEELIAFSVCVWMANGGLELGWERGCGFLGWGE